jgi:hypothetical protein
MAFTRPSDLTFDFLVDVPTWNAHAQDWQYVYDNSQGINYTPTWSTAGTAPTLGNGALLGKYGRIGKFVWFWMSFQSGSSTNFGTGRFEFLLPVAAAGVAFHGAGIMIDKLAQIYTGVAILAGGPQTEFALTFTGDTGIGGCSGTTPFTWNGGNGDELQCSGFYLAQT